VKGRVQGVGFRWWTRARALELGLAGTATNRDDGPLQVVAEGPEGGGGAHPSLEACACDSTPARVHLSPSKWGSGPLWTRSRFVRA
jgi:acylphosphatase